MLLIFQDVKDQLTHFEHFQEGCAGVRKSDGYFRPRRVAHALVEDAEAGEDAEG